MQTKKQGHISGNKTKKRSVTLEFTEWPYYASFITSASLAKLVAEMKTLNFQYSTQPYKPITFNRRTPIISSKYKDQYVKFIDADYLKYDVLPLIYSEEELLKCQFRTNPPAIEYFNKHKHELYMEFKKRKLPHTLPEYREFLFSKVKQCNNFRPTLALQTYNFLNDNKAEPQCILDFSAGWGDRLFAACVGNKKYIGLDPNTNNNHIYETIIRNHGSPDMQKVVATGAEYIAIPDLKIHMTALGIKTFDLIFTSPPYFDYEIYASTTQSISSYTGSSSFEKWLCYFLFNVILRYVPLLRHNGYIGIYIQDTDKNNYLEPIGLFAMAFAKELGLTVCGIISSTRFPMIILQKVGSAYPYINTENKRVFTSNSIKKLFIKHYPKVYAYSHRLIKLNKLGLPTPVLTSNASTVGSKILLHPSTTSKVSLSNPFGVYDNLRLGGMEQHYKNIIIRTLEKVFMQLDTGIKIVKMPNYNKEYISKLKGLLKAFNINLIIDDKTEKNRTVYVTLNPDPKNKYAINLGHLLTNTIDEWMLLNNDNLVNLTFATETNSPVSSGYVYEHCVSLLTK